MKTRIIYLLFALAVLSFKHLVAQENTVTTDTLIANVSTIDQLRSEREKIFNIEKENLKIKVLKIEKQLEENQITKDEARNLKMEAAQLTAKNIENRTAIIDNQIALLERDQNLNTDKPGSRIILGIGKGNDDDENTFFGFTYKNSYTNGKVRRKRNVVYDRRITSDFVFAIGLNNAIIQGQSLNDTPYKIGGSRFLELGWSWKTRVFDNSNWLRFKYGFSFQFNGLKIDDNQYFVENGDETLLQTYPFNLHKAKLRMDNLVFPVFFEFGPSKRKDYDDHFRYSTDDKFKMGLGAYGGLNLLTIQKLKYEADGNDRKDKFKQNYNTNNLIYGLSGYVAIGDIALYAKYDLNTIFKNNPYDERNISVGVRFDMD